MRGPLDLQALRSRNEERRRRKEAATPGLWIPNEVYQCVQTASGPLRAVCRYGNTDPAADMAFIASAKNDPVESDVDALLSEVERLRADAVLGALVRQFAALVATHDGLEPEDIVSVGLGYGRDLYWEAEVTRQGDSDAVVLGRAMDLEETIRQAIERQSEVEEERE